MNKSKVIVLLVVLNLLLVGICLNFSNKNMLLINEKQIIKEMTQSENEANLQTQINQLNASHKEYVTNVQAYKKQIAEAVTNQGVATSENDEGSVIAENISKISNGTGKLYYLGNYSFATWDGSAVNTAINFTVDVTNIEGYESFNESNFLVGLEKSGTSMYAPVDWTGNPSTSSSVTYSYDNSTGILTVSKPSVKTTSVSGYFAMTCDTYAKIWLYTGSEIIDFSS